MADLIGRQIDAVIIGFVVVIVFIVEIRLISSLVGIIEKHSKSDQKKQSKCYFNLFIYFTG